VETYLDIFGSYLKQNVSFYLSKSIAFFKSYLSNSSVQVMSE